MSRSIPELDTVLREALARRIGADLYRQAAAISPRTVDAVAAAVSGLVTNVDYGDLVAEGFGGAMVGEAAVTHLSTLRETTLDDSVSVDPPHVANPSTVSPAEF